MNKTKTFLEQISDAVASALPADLAKEVRENVKSTVQGACQGLDLVTREELEVQEAVLHRTRQKLERLEVQMQALEDRILRQ